MKNNSKHENIRLQFSKTLNKIDMTNVCVSVCMDKTSIDLWREVFRKLRGNAGINIDDIIKLNILAQIEEFGG